MNRRATYHLVAVFALLLAAWWAQRYRQQERAAELAQPKPLVAGFTLDAYDRIEVIHAAASTLLDRQGSGWTVTAGGSRLPADPTAVDRLARAVERATIAAVAANAQDDLTPLGLAATQRVTVRFTAGGQVRRELQVGQSSDDYLSSSVTTSGDPRVYLVDGLTREDIATDWRDLTALQIDGERATQIAYTQPRHGFTLTRDNTGEWTLDGQPTQAEVIKELVRELSNLSAEDVRATHATFTPSGVTIEVNTPSGTQALLVGPAHPDGGVFIKTGAGYFYTLSKKTKEKILPTRRALLR